MNVLVADDDEDIREMAVLILSSRGLDVTTVTSGVEASVALAERLFDVAVLDQNMPPGSGMEVVVERRSLGDTTPIVLWSGWAGSLDRDETDRLGVTVIDKTDIQVMSRVVLAMAHPS